MIVNIIVSLITILYFLASIVLCYDADYPLAMIYTLYGLANLIFLYMKGN